MLIETIDNTYDILIYYTVHYFVDVAI